MEFGYDKIANMAFDLGYQAEKLGIDVKNLFSEEDYYGLNKTALMAIELGRETYKAKMGESK